MKKTNSTQAVDENETTDLNLDTGTGTDDRIRYQLEREKHYTNIAEILKHSNATPIRSQDLGGYLCCFCGNQYRDPSNLKQHTIAEHSDCTIRNASFTVNRTISAYCVKLDITALRCKICEIEIDTLEDLISHLTDSHQINMYTDIKNQIIPFKFNGEELSCFMCCGDFNSFRSLLEHMNVHYSNFICNICGAGFVTRAVWVKHSSKVHKTGAMQRAAQNAGIIRPRDVNVNLRYKGTPSSKKESKESSNVDENPHKKAVDKQESRRTQEKHYSNMKQILLYSNATAIRNHSDGGYSCCFCSDQYPDPADLKKHNNTAHNDCNISNASFAMRSDLNSYHVKLDITALYCAMCNNDIETLEQLIDHLITVHGIKIYTDINNRILPFKFDTEDMTCFICSNVFHSFKTLIEHMNIHYRNYICEVCDAGFVSRSRALTHAKTHNIGTFKCQFCTKVYDTHMKKKSHERTVHTHSDGRNRCGLCNEVFKYFSYKLKHLSEVHGIDSLVKCQACDKSFVSQKKMRIHVRKHHLLERPFNCTHCDMKFFTSSELKYHMVKHTGLKNFQCKVCEKWYGLKKTLINHMRSHELHCLQAGETSGECGGYLKGDPLTTQGHAKGQIQLSQGPITAVTGEWKHK